MVGVGKRSLRIQPSNICRCNRLAARGSFAITVSVEIVMAKMTRRGLLGDGAGGLAAASVLSTARAAGFGNPDEPPQGAINATNPASLTGPGPHNPAIAHP